MPVTALLATNHVADLLMKTQVFSNVPYWPVSWAADECLVALSVG